MPIIPEAIMIAGVSALSAVAGALLNGAFGFMTSRHSSEKVAQVEEARLEIEANKLAVSAIDTAQKALLELVRAQESKIVRLDARIDKAYEERDLLKRLLDDEQDYTETLLNHINKGLPPPPPNRKPTT